MSEDVLNRGLVLARESGDVAAQVEALCWLARTRSSTDPDLERYLALIDEAVPLARSVGGRALALALMGDATSMRDDDLERAERLAIEAGEVLHSLGKIDSDLEAFRMSFMGVIYALRGDDEQSRQWTRIGLNFARRQGNLYWEASLLGDMAVDEREAGNLQMAQSYARTAIDRARELGQNEMLSRNLYVLGTIETMLGNHSEAERVAFESIALAHKLGISFTVLSGVFVYARITAARGNVSNALRLVGLINNRGSDNFPPLLQKRIDEFIAELDLPAEEVEAGLAAGAALDLDTVVLEILDGEW
jgi:ATP/maltotriose-dependent transcriptional regulator MalT